MAAPDSYYGQQRPQTFMGDYNPLEFVASQLIKRINTATLVKVQSVTKSGELDAVGMMDVIPLVNMVEGGAQISKHGTIRQIIYARMQGGEKAVILDPKVGDIGVAVFTDRDISNVRATKNQAPPGSRRRFDMADGVWVMTVLGDKPKVYVQFKDDDAKTVIVGNGVESEENPMELVVSKDHVQMKKKGSPTLHVTVDAKDSQIVLGKEPVIGPDPFPND